VNEHGPNTEWSKDPRTLSEQVKSIAGEMDIDDLRALSGQLLAARPGGVEVLLHPAPNCRCPRRQEIHTYRVRVDIVGARPRIWRRLEVSSDLMLDDLHVVLQAAFGWTDSHLHRFGAGSSIWDRGTELYLCPFDVDEGEDDGVPENQVRLDEVLVDVGDSLPCVYDYGDNWEHRIRLEAVSDRAAGLPVVTCVGGRRAGPPEDCGGIPGAVIDDRSHIGNVPSHAAGAIFGTARSEATPPIDCAHMKVSVVPYSDSTKTASATWSATDPGVPHASPRPRLPATR